MIKEKGRADRREEREHRGEFIGISSPEGGLRGGVGEGGEGGGGTLRQGARDEPEETAQQFAQLPLQLLSAAAHADRLTCVTARGRTPEPAPVPPNLHRHLLPSQPEVSL